MSGDTQAVAQLVIELVGAEGTLQGSRLATAVRQRFPSWRPTDAGCLSLRQFIQDHVEGVEVVGRSGMDVIYGRPGTESAPTVPPLAAPPTADAWRVWISPFSPLALAVLRNGTEVRAVPRSQANAPDEVVVMPPGTDSHRAVARGFLAGLSEPLRGRLEALLASDREPWWRAWTRELTVEGQLGQWIEHRVREFEQLFAEALEAGGLDANAIATARRLLRIERTPGTKGIRRTADAISPASDELARARKLALAVVERMSGSELRDLRLPLGLMLDALADAGSR